MYLADKLILVPVLVCFSNDIASADNTGPFPEKVLGAPETESSQEATSNAAFSGISGGYLANNLFVFATNDCDAFSPLPILPKYNPGPGKLDTLNVKLPRETVLFVKLFLPDTVIVASLPCQFLQQFHQAR